MRDNDFFIDQVNAESTEILGNTMTSQHDSLDSFWPYMVVEDFSNHLLIFNSYEQDIIQQVEFPKEYILDKIWISETLDLFFLGQDSEKYVLFQIDLDSYENQREKKD